MYSDIASRLLRRAMLFYARRMNPERMRERSRVAALKLALRAAACSPAYRTVLREQGGNIAALNLRSDFSSLPILTKANTFQRFSLAELSRPIPSSELADVLTSSGRCGRNFGFRLTARKQHEGSWFDIDLGLQDVFDVDRTQTLLVNCLPMGVAFRSRAVAVANVSVREDMACSVLIHVGPRFGQTLLCSDPLFIRRVLDEGRAMGVDWQALNTSVVLGEEMVVEAQRDYIAARMGIDVDHDPCRMIGSSFGIGELGLNLLFESRETIRIRRAMRNSEAIRLLVAGRSDGSLPSVFCYNPLRCHVEVIDADAHGCGELCITVTDSHAVILLPRYASGDYGRLVSPEQVVQAACLAGPDVPWLPVAVVFGRIADRAPHYPSVEEIKEILYLDHGVADRLSGAFRLSSDWQGVRLTVQASSEESADDPDLRSKLTGLLNRGGWSRLRVEILSPVAFPCRPILDFERKFAYVAT